MMLKNRQAQTKNDFWTLLPPTPIRVADGRIMLSGENGRTMESAHRANYLTFVGPIPESTIIRQSCGNRLCVNPEHLEVLQERSVHH